MSHSHFKDKVVATTFVSLFDSLCSEVHGLAVNNGFWEGEYNYAEKLALIHSEISELLESSRQGELSDMSEKIPDFTKEEEELADIIIRCMDLSSKRLCRLSQAILAKHQYNCNRPYKHGKLY